MKGIRGPEKAISEAIYNSPDLILIDLKASNRGGLNVCRELKSNPITYHIPIVIVAAKGRDSDIVAGRRLGADNCLTRPLRYYAFLQALRWRESCGKTIGMQTLRTES